MKQNQTQKAFTLVELIVVITILAILGTIVFISLQGYSEQARDSTRISDLSTMKISLELFNLDAGKYPLPTGGEEITYSGGLIWTQGNFGEQTNKNIEKLNKIPLDPLTYKEYVYSTTWNRQEFQLVGIMEGNNITLNRLGYKAEAGTKTAKVKIDGNYNGKLLKVSTGGLDYVIAIPSIISSTGTTTINDIVGGNGLAYNGYSNLPSQYEGSKYTKQGSPNLVLVNPSDLTLFVGNIDDLSNTKQQGISTRKRLLLNIQKAYTGTTLKNDGEISRILAATSDNDIALLSSTLVSNSLGGSVELIVNSTKITTPTVDNTSCKTILESDPESLDGVYNINPENNGNGFNVYCDMTTDGGGWALVYKIADSSSMKNTGIVGTENNLANSSLGDSTSYKLSDIIIKAIYTSQYKIIQYGSSKVYLKFDNILEYGDNIESIKYQSSTYDSNANYTSLAGIVGFNYGFSTWNGSNSIITQLNYSDTRLGSHEQYNISSSDIGCGSNGGCHIQVFVK